MASLLLRKGTADERTMRAVLQHGQYDVAHLNRRSELSQFHQRAIARAQPPLIIDLGANIGASALYFNHVWPESRIVAVEPSPDNFSLLKQNIDGRTNILPVHAGIASQDGFMRIVDDDAETDAFKTEPGVGDIPALSMATLLRDEVGAPFICKIDIEGAERDLFSRDTEWIDQFPLIMIELHDWMLPGEAASQNFLKAVADRRRDFTFNGETIFSLRCPIL